MCEGGYTVEEPPAVWSTGRPPPLPSLPSSVRAVLLPPPFPLPLPPFRLPVSLLLEQPAMPAVPAAPVVIMNFRRDTLDRLDCSDIT